MGSAALAEAAKSIRDWSLNDRTSTTPAVRAADVFGSLVFNDKLQQERLPKPAYRALRATITRGEPLDLSTADAVASALKDWAVEHGATHRTRLRDLLVAVLVNSINRILGVPSLGP
jgi:glutamine synthetase